MRGVGQSSAPDAEPVVTYRMAREHGVTQLYRTTGVGGPETRLETPEDRVPGWTWVRAQPLWPGNKE